MRKRYFILPTLLYQVAAIEHLLRHDSSKSRAGQDIRRSLTRDERRQNSVSNKAQDMLNTLVYHWNSNNHGDFSSSDKNDMKIVERHVHSRKLRRETGNSLLCGRDLHSPTTHPLKDSDNDDEEGNTTTISTIVQEISNGTDIITTTTSTTIITTTKVVTTIYSNENGTDSSGNPIIETNSTTTVMTSSNNETTTLVAPVENSASTTSSSGVDDEVLSMEFPNSTPLSTNNIDIQGYTNDMGTMAQYNDGGRTHESSENHDKNLLWSLVLDAPIDKTNTNTVTGSNSSNSSSSTGTTELTVTELSPELNQAIQSPKKASILSGSFKIDSCTYTTAIYADVVDYSTRFTIGEVYYVIRKFLATKICFTPAALCVFTISGKCPEWDASHSRNTWKLPFFPYLFYVVQLPLVKPRRSLYRAARNAPRNHLVVKRAFIAALLTTDSSKYTVDARTIIICVCVCVCACY